jgi:hypothetical protein
LALWGATLSTILAIFEFFKFLDERPRLIVKVGKSYGVNFYPNSLPPQASIFVSVANRSKRPITILQLNIYMSKKIPLVVSADNYEITEGKTYCWRESEHEHGMFGDKCVACAVDVTGRYFWSHNLLVRCLKTKDLFSMLSLRFKWLFRSK